MKRLAALALAGLLLIACGPTAPDQNIHEPADGGIPDKTDVPPDGPDTPDEGEKQPTYLTRAQELINNLDHLPSGNALYESSSVKKGKKTIQTAQSGWVDITEKDPAFYDSPAKDHELVASQVLRFDIFDTAIYEIAEDIRHQIIDNIVMLDTWVNLDFGEGMVITGKGRLSFDSQADVATMEYVTPSSYLRFTSTYDAEGNILIKGGREDLYEKEGELMPLYFSLEYHENDYYKCSCYSPYDNKLINAEKDYKTPESPIAMNVSQFDLTFSDPRIFWSDGDLVYALNGGLRVANEKGKTFLELFSNQLLVNLHYFDGYDQFLYDPATGEAKITIEGQEYANKLGEAKGFASGMTLLNTKSNVYPALEFSIFNPDGTTANRDVLINGMAAVLDEYGLTCTEADFKTLLQNGLEYRDSLVGFEGKKVMERTYEDIVDYDKALRFFEPLGEEGVGAYFNAESLDKDEQVEDEEYYALTPATYAGEATIKDDSVDFSSLSLALEANSLLLEASQYRLALLYKGLSENLTYNGAPAIYEGEPLTLAFDGSITLPADLDDEFEVYAYVENENGQRLSSLFPVKAVEGLDLLLDEGSTAYHYFEENGYLKLSAAPTEDEEIGREEEPNTPDEGEEAGPNEPEA